MIVWISVVAVVIVVAVLLATWDSDKKRHDTLQAWARQRDWTYKDRDDSTFEGFGGDPFGTGKSRQATDVITGTIGDRRAVIFSYRYTEPTYNSSNTYHYSVVALSMPCAVGHLAIKPQGLFATVGTKAGFADRQLDSDAFNSAFRLSSSSQQLANDLMPPRNIDLLLDQPDADLRTERDLLLAVGRGPLTVHHIDVTLAILSTFLDSVPPSTWEDHDVDRPMLGPPEP